MEKNHSMQRLLEWDVWTGKTIIALIIGIHAIIESKNSIQVAFMVPTEILARQHFEAIQELLSYYNLTSNLLVWSTTAKEKKEIKNLLKNWEIDIIVWTHALIQEDVFFNNLWFVVVDEQHRFWVKQRETLESGIWNKSGLVPHVLNMTATPIPRTLALTLYGDQDLSVIKEYPAWRKLIHTKVAKSDEERQQIELFVRTQIEAWRQVFWISPLVEESEKIDLANAISTFEFLQDIYQPFKVWLLHGKMKPKEKESIMKDFSDNKIAVLSSTSVVEVWVNIPNATIMCIEWAERFWLSQLHQFRWRVGRGEYQSYCYLFPSKWNYTDRLKAMERTNNWFELAEIDLELRWPGEVYWVRQSWLPDLKIADLKDLELVSQIREDIEEMLKE
jgi:ATP-dependent DNA helicase RecG